jgi:hypothetical protein
MCCQLTVRYNDHVFDLAVINEPRYGLQFFVIKPSFYVTKPYWNIVVCRPTRPWTIISKAFYNSYILYRKFSYSNIALQFLRNLSNSDILLQIWYSKIFKNNLTQTNKVMFYIKLCLVCFGATAPSGPGPPHSRGFHLTHNSSRRVINSSQRRPQVNTQ